MHKEKLELELDDHENGNPESKAVFSTIQNRGSKEWLLNNDLPERPVCCKSRTSYTMKMILLTTPS
jgi:hypothetical protein